jgi:hypothetical protein
MIWIQALEQTIGSFSPEGAASCENRPVQMPGGFQLTTIINPG